MRLDGLAIDKTRVIAPATHGIDGCPIEHIRRIGAGDEHVRHRALGSDREANVYRTLDSLSRSARRILRRHAMCELRFLDDRRGDQ